MACECIQKIEKEALNKLKVESRYKKPVKNVSLDGLAWVMPSSTPKTCNNLVIELEGQRSKKHMSMIHTYCPFCGVKYENNATAEGGI